jgi:hypothetical protein
VSSLSETEIARPLTSLASIFLVFFVVSMQQQIQFNLQYYVTSSFMLLPLTGTTSILSSVIGGAIKLPTAKFVDLIGRAEGFLIMTGFATLGIFTLLRFRRDNSLTRRG